MLPCISKQVFGFECLGCGMQRSLVLITKGEFIEAFKMYPAIYTLIILAIFVVINFKAKTKTIRKIISRLTILNLAIIIISYLIKITQ